MALAAQDAEGLWYPSKSPMGQAVRWLLTTFSLPIGRPITILPNRMFKRMSGWRRLPSDYPLCEASVEEFYPLPSLIAAP